MNYRSMAHAILETLPPPALPALQRSKESDDERIARVVWRRMQLEMNLDHYSANRSSLLV